MLKFLALLCALSLAVAVPVPDSDEYYKVFQYQNANPGVNTYSSFVQPAMTYGAQFYKADDDRFDFDDDDHRFAYAVQPQVATEYRQPVVTNVQPNTYSGHVFRVDDDRYDFDDDDYKFVHVAQPAAVVQPQPAVQHQPQITDYSANTVTHREAPVQVSARSATNQVVSNNVPATYHFVRDDFDDNSGEVFRSFGTSW